VIASLSALGGITQTHAALLVYEGYNYGGTSVNMNGLATSTTGLSGNYSAVAGGGATGTGSAIYVTTGLTFGSNFPTGIGGATTLVDTRTGGSGLRTETLTATISATNTGTTYSSYLVNFAGLPTTANAFSAATGAMGNLQASFKQSTSEFSTKPGVGMGTGSGGTAYTPTTSTTYLVLARNTNVGTTLSVSTTGVSDLWVMDLASYDAWFTAGANEGNLSSFADATATQTLTTGGPFTLNGTFSTALNTGGNNYTITGTYDEFRVGALLSDVVAVPEPGAIALLGLGLGFILLVCRRPRFNRAS
jgi:hypothetical protein